MLRICAWCGRVLEELADTAMLPITHGICQDCHDALLAELPIPIDRFLDTLPAPVVLVDGDAKVAASNRLAAAATGQPPQALIGRPLGQVFECANAGLPGGCGSTDHCSACTIRNSVTHTYRTGEPLRAVPAVLKRGTPGSAEQISLRISTEKVGGLVLLQVAEVVAAG